MASRGEPPVHRTKAPTAARRADGRRRPGTSRRVPAALLVLALAGAGCP